MRLDDPELVRREYASEAGLAARASVYDGEFGEPDARRSALEAVRAVSPRRVLEVGCGRGEFAERLARELDADVVALDLSPRMVELTRKRGIDARVGDVGSLPFADHEFDCAVANWILYHVPDLDRALAELARVLTADGRLVAATSGLAHLRELWTLVGRDRANEPARFFAETGERFLSAHLARLERRDVTATIVFDDVAAVRRYVAASVAHKHLADRVPAFVGPLPATKVNAVFVADKAR